jgi:Methyltransferase FkbM domain
MIQALLQALQVYDAPSHRKYRLGRDFDGGYVILDGFEYGKLYSYGVADDISFELDFVGHHPMPVQLYDFSIDKLPVLHPMFNFCKEGVRGEWRLEKAWVFYLGYSLARLIPLKTDYWRTVLRKFIRRSWKYALCKTLQNQLQQNGDQHRNDLFLKIDIEGSEYEVFKAMSDAMLNCFKQIVIEVHGLEGDEHVTMAEKIAFFRRLNRNFFLVHAHANNFRPIHEVAGHLIPSVMELTYVRKDLIPSVWPSEAQFPGPLDRACNPLEKDHVLDFYPFTPQSIAVKLH